MKILSSLLLVLSATSASAGNSVIAIGDCRNITSNGIITHRKIAIRIQSNAEEELNYVCRTKVAKAVAAEYSADPSYVESSVSVVLKMDQSEASRLSSFMANPTKMNSQLSLKGDSLH